MSDLVERLRLPRKLEPRDDQTTVVPIELLDEAADEIERLRAALQEALTQWRAWMESVREGDYDAPTEDDCELFDEIEEALKGDNNNE